VLDVLMHFLFNAVYLISIIQGQKLVIWILRMFYKNVV